MKKNNLNININKEDDSLNDFLYCWDIFGTRPNKTLLYSNFDFAPFSKFLEEQKSEEISVFSEIIPSEEGDMINKKCFCKISENIFLSYQHFDGDAEESFVNEVYFIFQNDAKSKIDDLISTLNEIPQVSIEDEISKEITFKSLSSVNAEFELNSTKILKADYDNIDLYFNDSVIKSFNKLRKNINKNKKGLTIIYGQRGTGKTTLVNYLIQNLKKQVIFVPSTLYENIMINPDFRNFLKKNSDSVIIMDDLEIYLSEIYSKSNIFSNNLIQMIDGFDSDHLGLNFILISNTNNIDDIDHSLLDCNNLIDVINVEELSLVKSKELIKHLKKKNKVKTKTKLVDILKTKPDFIESNEIGFS